GAVLERVIARPLQSRTLHVAEVILYAREEDLQAPALLVAEILAVGLEQIRPVEPLGLRLLVRLRGPGHRGGRGLIGEVVIARDAGVPLFEPPDRLMHLGRVAQVPLGDARLEFLEIAEEALLVLGADRTIFLGAALTAAH